MMVVVVGEVVVGYRRLPRVCEARGLSGFYIPSTSSINKLAYVGLIISCKLDTSPTMESGKKDLLDY